MADFIVDSAGVLTVRQTSRWPLFGWWVVERHYRLGANAYVVHVKARCWTRWTALRRMRAEAIVVEGGLD